METNNELNVEIIDSIFFPGLGMLEWISLLTGNTRYSAEKKVFYAFSIDEESEKVLLVAPDCAKLSRVGTRQVNRLARNPSNQPGLT